jgi:hypothetical protein
MTFVSNTQGGNFNQPGLTAAISQDGAGPDDNTYRDQMFGPANYFGEGLSDGNWARSVTDHPPVRRENVSFEPTGVPLGRASQ